MQDLSLGVVARSRKPDEYRVAIHPEHLGRIDAELRRRIFLERGYGQRFGISDDRLAAQVGGLRSREQLIDECDVVVLPKPLVEDLTGFARARCCGDGRTASRMRPSRRSAIDRQLTLIAWEAMNYWTDEGNFSLHVFHKNNELAGYCSVMHALALMGTTGAYGRRLRAAVISFGATARGAVTALFALGVHDVTVLTHRGVAAVASPMAPARLVHYERDPDRPGRTLALNSSGSGSVAEALAEHDIVVNCILQDTDDPLIFVSSDELGLFRSEEACSSTSPAMRGWALNGRVRRRSPIRCSRSQAARATTPSTTARPTYGTQRRGRSARRSSHISRPSCPAGTPGHADLTIRRAIEIRAGVVQNPKILSFQSRSSAFPHVKF